MSLPCPEGRRSTPSVQFDAAWVLLTPLRPGDLPAAPAHRQLGPPGFEPGQTEPKSAVLPLHHGPVWGEDDPRRGRVPASLQEPAPNRRRQTNGRFDASVEGLRGRSNSTRKGSQPRHGAGALEDQSPDLANTSSVSGTTLDADLRSPITAPRAAGPSRDRPSVTVGSGQTIGWRIRLCSPPSPREGPGGGSAWSCMPRRTPTPGPLSRGGGGRASAIRRRARSARPLPGTGTARACCTTAR